MRVDENRRPRRPGAMKTSEEGRAGVITVLQARESDFRNQRKRPPSTSRGWLWKTPLLCCCLPASLIFFFATSENVNSFFFLPRLLRKEMLYLYVDLVSSGAPSNPRHQPSCDERDLEPLVKKRRIGTGRTASAAMGTASPCVLEP